MLLALVTLALILYFFRVRNGHRNTYLEREPTGAPSVVIVTVTDPETHASGYLNHIRENREQYADATWSDSRYFPMDKYFS